jgi:uncharacterized protein YndB with AHSA1/START domain
MSTSQSNPTSSRYAPTGEFRGSAGIYPSVAELAARLPSLEVSALLGHGGMGAVYKGRQPMLERDVAIKIMHPELRNQDGFQERFLQEARMLAKLRHHETGVVHRDIKPENILVDARGRVRVVDFGLAKLVRSSAAAEAGDNAVAGTRGYMAPEQMTMPDAVDHRADIYSTGVVLHEMLAGELPNPDPLPPSQKAPIDPRLDPIVLRSLARDRDRRYQEARAMQSDIEAVARTPQTSLRLEANVAAPAERVFELWTNPREWSDWLAPSDDFGPTTGEVDLEVAGTYRIGMLLPGTNEPRVASGQYCRIESPHTLCFTWAWQAPHDDANETQITLEFHPRGQTTDVVLTHERFHSEASRNSHEQGWQGCLKRLTRKLEP